MQCLARSFKIVPSELRLETTLKCGQSFRWTRIASPEPASIAFRGAFKGRVVTLVQTSSEITFSSIYPKDFDGIDDTEQFLQDYLNLKVDLQELYSQWGSRDKHFSRVSQLFLGLRMLRQDPFENLLSFICSSNNNIARITQMVQNLCKHYGKHIANVDGVEYYTFPEPEALLHATLNEELRALGFGYRAKFIAATVQQLSLLPANHLESLRHKSYEEAHADLLQFTGVGPKVADCVCLMSLDKSQAVPIDTHVLQIAQRDYKFRSKGSSMTKILYDQIKNFFIDLWGPYAGWAHSVLFVADLKTFENGTVDAWHDLEQIVPKVEIKIQPDQDAAETALAVSTTAAVKNEPMETTVLSPKIENEQMSLSSKRPVSTSASRLSKRVKRESVSTTTLKVEQE